MNAPDTLHAAAQHAHIHLHLLAPSPTNPRHTFPQGPLEELAETIRRHGVLQPILVRPWPSGQATRKGSSVYDWEDGDGTPGFEIVAGERRYRASVLAEQPTIPAIVRDLTDTDVLEIQTIENLQREDVHPLEEAEGYALLLARTQYTADDLAAKLGKSKAYVYARLKLTALTGEARAACLDGRISASVALLIARIPVPKLQAECTKEVLRGWGSADPMSARQAAEHIQRHYMLKLAEAPFPRAATDLVKGVPRCHECQKRTGNQKELFSDVKSADVCTDPECWNKKRAAHIQNEARQAEARGVRPITGDEARRIAPYGCDEYVGPLKGGLALLDATAQGAKRDAKGHAPTWRQLLGEAAPVAALVEDTRKGGMHEAAKLDDLKAAAKARGIELGTDRAGTQDDSDKQREKVAKAETALRRTLVEKVVERSDGLPLDGEELRLVAERLFELLDFEAQKLTCRLWGLEGKIEHAQIREFAASIPEMNPADVHRLLRLLTHVGSIHVGSWTSEPTALPKPMLAACAKWGINPSQVREDLAGASKKPPKLAHPENVKYRDPGSGNSWSGKGKRPAWVTAWLVSGNTLEALEA